VDIRAAAIKPPAKLQGRVMSSDDLLPAGDASALKTALAPAVERSGSVEAFADWLRSRQQVEAVDVSGYLVKTEPPQREVTVLMRTGGAGTARWSLDIAVQTDGSLCLRRIHPP